MPNSRFSSLVYRIIGKPEVIHEEYSNILNSALQEMDLFTDPSHFAEVEIGHQILNRIENSDDAIKALNALLDDGRFKIIILNEQLSPIYNNLNARKLLDRLVSPTDDKKLNTNLLSAIQSTINSTKKQNDERSEELIPLDYLDRDEDKIYLKTVTNQTNSNDKNKSCFQLLLALDQSKRNPLNQQLINRYEFTTKEQQILIGLIHGNTVKEIAANEFISENTVKTHLKSLYRKTDTKSQTQIVGMMLSHESQILDSYFNNQTDFSNLEHTNVEDKSVILNGNTIFYRDYGKSDGDVLIVFHNGYSSRLMVPKNYQAICEKTNRRIIIIDRPGYGKTNFIKGHPNKWHLMLNEFIDHLKIGSYEVLGAVLGCTLAIKFASQADERLKRLILSAPFFINQESDGKHLLGILAPSQKIVKGSAQFAKQVYELWLKSVTLNLSTNYRKMIVNGVGSSEQEQFEQDGTIDLIVETFREAASQTLKGISNEMAYCMTPLNIDLNKITIPVDLWWGSEDERFTREGIEQLAKDIPNCNLYIKEGYTEHIYYALFEQMINTKRDK